MIFRLSWNVLSAGTQGSVNVTGSSARVELPFKIPKGRTYSPPACGWWYCLRQPCALRGGCGVRGRLQPMPPCLRACRSSAARLTHISHADSDQHGKYAAGMILMPVNRVGKPATGSFAGVWMPAGIQSLLFRKRSRNRLYGAGKENVIDGNLP